MVYKEVGEANETPKLAIGGGAGMCTHCNGDAAKLLYMWSKSGLTDAAISCFYCGAVIEYLVKEQKATEEEKIALALELPVRRRYGGRWKKKSRIIRLLCSDRTMEQIGRETGVTRQYVSAVARECGLERRGRTQ